MTSLSITIILKNEGHIIVDTLNTLRLFLQIDRWFICDTGSTDNTKEIVQSFFDEHSISGEIYDTPWKDFGHNRTIAFEKAYNTTDYVFVWDADDTIVGDFKLPSPLTADWYKFTFGNTSGFRYSRCQLFNNRKKWKYVGVLHEYPAPNEEGIGEPVDVIGNYYFCSGRKGSRNKDPLKYQNDALILAKAFDDAYATKDPIYSRYAFYCAQSYRACNENEKAIEYYKKVLTLDNWAQEKYVSCLEIFDAYAALQRPMEGLSYLVESYRYDTQRIECFYRLIKYYCISGLPEIAYMYYTRIQHYYETIYPTDSFTDKLFVKTGEYSFYLPYYMIIVGDRIQRKDICAKMYTILFKKAYIYISNWWIHNLFYNIQFCINELPITQEFLQSMLDYIDLLQSTGCTLQESHLRIIETIINRYRAVLTRPPTSLPSTRTPVRIMLSITTCKRRELFEKTMNSILHTWTDMHMIDYYYCVDDNSSTDDRSAMVEAYPFFTYYMKSPEEKGHRTSMNIIWNKLRELRPTFWIHLEDDWLFYHTGPYVMNAIGFLEKYKADNIHQIVFNKNYGLLYSDAARVGGIPLEGGAILHEKRDGLVGKNCGYWPHYSLHPSVTRADTILALGNYDSANTFFERDYAEKYYAAGYKTAFFPSIYSMHIGKQHWETDGKNAYALNDIAQFKASTPIAAPTVHRIHHAPLEGSAREHLTAILDTIQSRTPFGIVCPNERERYILLGKSLTHSDGWVFTAGDRIQYQLTHALQIINPALYIGIPCNTCDTPLQCTQEIYSDYMKRFGVPRGQRTYTTIFRNSNWKPFIEFLQSYTPGFFFITSGTQYCSTLPIKERYIISNTLLHRWNTECDSETMRLLHFIRGKKNELICFAAGPLSTIWIPMCMECNPDNMYIDVGGSLDSFVHASISIDPSTFIHTPCIFNDTLSM